jgi:hypothetical protein
MAILNATAMERDRVNLGWSVPVQKCQQIVETVAARHRSTLHYCLSRYGSCFSHAPVATTSLALWPCPHSKKRSISATHANAVDPGLGLLGPGSGSVGSPPNLIQDFASLSIRPRKLGSLTNEERRHSRFRGRLRCGASEFGLMQEALYRRTGGSLPQRHNREGLDADLTIRLGQLSRNSSSRPRPQIPEAHRPRGWRNGWQA